MNSNNSENKGRERKRPGARGGGPAIHTTDKAKDFKGSMKMLIAYIANHKIGLILIFIMALGSTVFAIVGPRILGMATTEVFEGLMAKIQGTGNIDFSVIGRILGLLITLYIISSLLLLIEGLIASKVSINVTYKLRNEIETKIHKLPISYFDKTTTGDVLSRMTNDVDVINQILSQGLTQIISSVATIIGITVMMFTISWQMTLIALFTLPLSGIVVALIVKKSQKHFDNQQTYIGKVNGQVEENYGAHTVIKAFNGEEKAINDFNRDNDKLYESAWKANFLSGLMMPALIFIGNLGYVVICIVGGYFVSGGLINIGDIQAFIQYTRQFSQPMSQVSQISATLQQTAAASERIFGFLKEEDQPEDSKDALSINLNKSQNGGIPITGTVDFENVSFGYTKDKIIINNFSAHVKPGQKVAIVGPTGAGKTTMVKLLMRFYDVNSGAIKLDGYDIRDFKRDQLRSAFGMVLQDTWLYNDSILENIKYGKLDATMEEIKIAAKAAQVDKFVASLPGEYNMVLNEDSSNMSQGQKQLITIARAILADPKILILDEATSSVDTRTEVLIQKAMDNLMEGRTSFIIAHRLSTIKNADTILVMDKGDIIEQGNHEELLELDGFYAKLYRSQFE